MRFRAMKKVSLLNSLKKTCTKNSILVDHSLPLRFSKHKRNKVMTQAESDEKRRKTRAYLKNKGLIIIYKTGL